MVVTINLKNNFRLKKLKHMCESDYEFCGSINISKEPLVNGTLVEEINLFLINMFLKK